MVSDINPTSLRERKKAKTRMSLQMVALKLFRKQGYEATTVEQIAAIAEVSPSTFFRYFPTKEDVVLYDTFDPLFIEAFRIQPKNLNPIEALRAAFKLAAKDKREEFSMQQRERGILILSVPELRMRMLEQFTEPLNEFTKIIAERVGRSPDDFAVRTFMGAIFGVMLPVIMDMYKNPDLDYFALIDKALAQLEAGLPL